MVVYEGNDKMEILTLDSRVIETNLRLDTLEKYLNIQYFSLRYCKIAILTALFIFFSFVIFPTYFFGGYDDNLRGIFIVAMLFIIALLLNAHINVRRKINTIKMVVLEGEEAIKYASHLKRDSG